MNQQAEADFEALERELKRRKKQDELRRVRLEPYTEAAKAGFSFCLISNLVLFWGGNEFFLWQHNVASVVLMVLVFVFDRPSTEEEDL